MKGASLEEEWLSRFSHSFFSGTETSKILGRFGDQTLEEFHGDSSRLFSSNRDFKKDSWILLFGRFFQRDGSQLLGMASIQAGEASENENEQNDQDCPFDGRSLRPKVRERIGRYDWQHIQ